MSGGFAWFRISAFGFRILNYVRHHRYVGKRRLRPSCSKVAAAGISRLRQRRRGFGVWRRPARSQEKGQNRRRPRPAFEIRTGRGNLGIGHTRWATHGPPSDKNSIRSSTSPAKSPSFTMASLKIMTRSNKNCSRRPQIQIRHRHRSARAFNWRLLRKAAKAWERRRLAGEFAADNFQHAGGTPALPDPTL